MKHTLISLFFCLLVAQYGFCQNYWVPKTALFDFLYHLDSPISNISNPVNKQKYLPIQDPHLQNYTQRLLKTRQGLFILIDGTGQVYKANGENAKQILFTRQDSTYFIGYNGLNYSFTWNDTLYSLGGTGFWRVNGQLRYFSSIINEWNIIKTNKEFPVLDFITNFLPNKSVLYYVTQPNNDGATYDITSDFLIVQLDLVNKQNKLLGKVTNPFFDIFSKSKGPNNYINLVSLNGTLVNLNAEEQYLFNFEKNAAYKLVNPLLKDLFYRKSAGELPMNCFEYNHRIYYKFPSDSDNVLKSIPISLNDFSKEPITIYESPISNSLRFLYIFIGFILGIVALFLIRKYFLLKTKSTSIIEKTDYTVEFNELEKQLILFLIDKTNRSEVCNVEEINFSLGISKKTLEIQKRTRTETIHRINHKFRLIYEIENDLIERVRSEEDKRYYHYIINKENAALYKKLYKK